MREDPQLLGSKTLPGLFSFFILRVRFFLRDPLLRSEGVLKGGSFASSLRAESSAVGEGQSARLTPSLRPCLTSAVRRVEERRGDSRVRDRGTAGLGLLSAQERVTHLRLAFFSSTFFLPFLFFWSLLNRPGRDLLRDCQI